MMKELFSRSKTNTKSKQKAKKNVLLIDDDADLAMLMTQFIREKIADADIEVATDPYEALNMMAEKSYDLVILDWNLQGITGGSTLREAEKGFASDPNLPQEWNKRATPVVVFSSQPKEACRGLEKLRYFKYAGHVDKHTGLDRVVNAIYAHYLLTA